jgi:hydroxyethylthiazole kinase-like uncharacterized protein yjeF
MQENEYYFDLPEIVICEKRGRSLFEKEKPAKTEKWAVITECSLGGAAGLAAARHIANCGAEVVIYLESPNADSCSDYATMLEVAGAMNLPLKVLGNKSNIAEKNYDKIIAAASSLPSDITSLKNIIYISDYKEDDTCQANLPEQDYETSLHKDDKNNAMSCERIREIDRQAIEEFGLPGICLMENAAIGAAAVAADMIDSNNSNNVLIAAGSGNNGGDGFAVARLLTQMGFQVKTALITGKEKLKGDALINYDIIEKAGLEIIDCSNDASLFENLLSEAYLIIDGLLGTGLSGEVRGIYKEAIESINKSGKKILALDIPSGLDGDSGNPLGSAVKADKTVTFAAAKEGFYKEEADTYTGEIILADIGAPFELIMDN